MLHAPILTLMRAVAAVALVVSLAAPARAEIYRWIDDAGTVHLDDDIARVPEAQRDRARIFKAKAPPPVEVAGPTQRGLAGALARELGLQATDTQDPISILQVVGIYPARGWNPQAALSTAVVQEVSTAARVAARAHRLNQSEVGAEAAVSRAATGLGVAAPPPVAIAEPAPAAPAPVVFAPNIVVEAPQPAVIVERVEPQPVPILSGYPTFGFGIPFASLPVPRTLGPIPDRITPLSDPAGQLHGPLVTPLHSRPFTRPSEF